MTAFLKISACGKGINRVGSCSLGFAWLALMALALNLAGTGRLAAQDVQTFDPDDAYAGTAQDTGAIDADLVGPAQDVPQPAMPQPVLPAVKPATVPGDKPSAADQSFGDEFSIYSEPPTEQGAPSWVDPSSGATVGEGDVAVEEAVAANDATYAEDDLIGAAEGVFGKGAKGLAKLIEDLLKKEGRPNGYIVGREAGGAFIVGARYGSGTLHHKVEGDRKVYWTGPSVGFDAGANAANTFVLVYNLYDTEDLFKRYPAGEGQAYFVGGLHASYMRRGDVVLIPIRLGAGVRLGVNAGYMKFSKKQRWLPF
jgi:hypothetical protein